MYWRHAGSVAAKSFSAKGKIVLLQRSVVSRIEWKLSRWPFQKSIAIDLHAVQCRMTAFLLKCERLVGEDINTYCRRRLRLARNFCNDVGMWSTLWCRRIVKWNSHLERSLSYKHFAPCCCVIEMRSGFYISRPNGSLTTVPPFVHFCRTYRHKVQHRKTAGRVGNRC